jgi:N-acetylglucosamine kinase-like BadF-type ATPase
VGILIADSGSTKTDWLYVGQSGKKEFQTVGINPFFQSSDMIYKGLQSVKWPGDVDTIYFYGAGVSTAANVETVRLALKRQLNASEIHIEHDLLGAARALCGNQQGIACILGTGSNSCAFDGQKIVKNIMSLGFLLGDEGSGGHMAKLLWKAYLLEELDSETEKLFHEHHGLERSEFLQKFYAQENKGRFVAGFTHFIGDHRDNPAIMRFAADSFDAFIQRYVMRYDNVKKMPVNFTGSIAYHFEEVLEERMVANNLRLGRILQKPITALASFHIDKA